MNSQSEQNEVSVIGSVDERQLEATEIMGDAIERLRKLDLEVQDEDQRDKITTQAVDLKTKISQLEGAREQHYDPELQKLKTLRAIYDTPLKMAKLVMESAMSKVSEYNAKKRREAEIAREKAEAEAKRQAEEAARKIREAEEAEAKAKAEAEARKKAEAEAKAREEERKRKEEEDKAAKAEAARKAEAEELERKKKEEEDNRLKHAQEAEDVGNKEKVEAILDTPKPIAQVAAQVPDQKTPEEIKAELEAEAEENRLKQEEETRIAEAKKREDEEKEKARLKREEADKAVAEAKEVQARVSAAANVSRRPDSRTTSTEKWQYKIENAKKFRDLVVAVAQMSEKDPTVLEYLGFNPKKPDEFKATALGKDLIRLKAGFSFPGVTTWLGEKTGVKVNEAEVE